MWAGLLGCAALDWPFVLKFTGVATETVGVRTEQRVLLFTLLSFRAVSTEEVLTDLGLSVHVDMTVNTVCVQTHALQEERANGHLVFGDFVREGAVFSIFAATAEEPGAHGDLLRVVDEGAGVPSVAASESIIENTELSRFLLQRPSDRETPLQR